MSISSMAEPAEAPGDLAFHCEGTFERDSLVWSFGKLAESLIDLLFRAPCTRARYARWQAEDVVALGPEGAEQGLLMIDLSLEADGTLKVIARPSPGEFVIVASHTSFHAVMATAYGLVSEPQQQDGVCLAHFEGDPGVASRWALGLHAWLARQSRAREPEIPMPGSVN
jgi:hypothetical protein